MGVSQGLLLVLLLAFHTLGQTINSTVTISHVKVSSSEVVNKAHDVTVLVQWSNVTFVDFTLNVVLVDEANAEISDSVIVEVHNKTDGKRWFVLLHEWEASTIEPKLVVKAYIESDDGEHVLLVIENVKLGGDEDVVIGEKQEQPQDKILNVKEGEGTEKDEEDEEENEESDDEADSSDEEGDESDDDDDDDERDDDDEEEDGEEDMDVEVESNSEDSIASNGQNVNFDVKRQSSDQVRTVKSRSLVGLAVFGGALGVFALGFIAHSIHKRYQSHVKSTSHKRQMTPLDPIQPTVSLLS
jgi:hypothetical protein